MDNYEIPIDDALQRTFCNKRLLLFERAKKNKSRGFHDFKVCDQKPFATWNDKGEKADTTSKIVVLLYVLRCVDLQAKTVLSSNLQSVCNLLYILTAKAKCYIFSFNCNRGGVGIRDHTVIFIYP